MSSRVRLRRDERLDQIIDEATEVIGRSGFHGFSLQEVADRCDMTVGGILHHVGTKEDLLVRVLQRRDDQDMGAVSGTADAQFHGQIPVETTSVEAAVQILDRIVERNSQQPAMVRLYAILRQESLDDGHPAHDYFRDRDAQALYGFGHLFERYADDSESLARQLLALMGGLEEQWLREPDAVDLVAEWRKARRAVLSSALTDPTDFNAWSG